MRTTAWCQGATDCAHSCFAYRLEALPELILERVESYNRQGRKGYSLMHVRAALCHGTDTQTTAIDLWWLMKGTVANEPLELHVAQTCMSTQ